MQIQFFVLLQLFSMSGLILAQPMQEHRVSSALLKRAPGDPIPEDFDEYFERAEEDIDKIEGIVANGRSKREGVRMET